jgi:hypothetical protein
MNLDEISSIEHLDIDILNLKLTVFLLIASTYEKTTLFPPPNPSETAPARYGTNSVICPQFLEALNKQHNQG